MEATDVRRLKDLEKENNRLARIFAGLSRENMALKDVTAATSPAHQQALSARSTPRVIVRLETSPSVDGCFATPSWPSRPHEEEVSFYSFKVDGYAWPQLQARSSQFRYSRSCLLLPAIYS